jgi:hypothetical protein
MRSAGRSEVAYTAIRMQNPLTGHIRIAPIGISWTVMLFGFFPPMFRGDWKWAILIGIATILSFGLRNLIFMFIYNGLYINELVGSGFKAANDEYRKVAKIASRSGMQIPLIKT